MRMRRRIGGDMPPSTLSVHGWLLLGATSPPPLAARVLHRIDRHASHTCLKRARSRTYWTCTAVGHGQGPCACMGLQRATAGHSGIVCLSLHRWPATYCTDSLLRSLPLIGPQTSCCLSSTFMHNRSPWLMSDTLSLDSFHMLCPAFSVAMSDFSCPSLAGTKAPPDRRSFAEQ